MDAQPLAQAKEPCSRIHTQSRKSEPGAIPDSRKCGFEVHGPALALNCIQYNRFQIELDDSSINILQSTLANYGLLNGRGQFFRLFRIPEAALQQSGAGVVQTGGACSQNRSGAQDYAVIEDFEMIGGKR